LEERPVNLALHTLTEWESAKERPHPDLRVGDSCMAKMELPLPLIITAPKPSAWEEEGGEGEGGRANGQMRVRRRSIGG